MKSFKRFSQELNAPTPAAPAGALDESEMNTGPVARKFFLQIREHHGAMLEDRAAPATLQGISAQNAAVAKLVLLVLSSMNHDAGLANLARGKVS